MVSKVDISLFFNFVDAGKNNFGIATGTLNGYSIA